MRCTAAVRAAGRGASGCAADHATQGATQHGEEDEVGTMCGALCGAAGQCAAAVRTCALWFRRDRCVAPSGSGARLASLAVLAFLAPGAVPPAARAAAAAAPG